MTVAIVGDTHMPRGERRLPERCLVLLTAAELIVHTGDFMKGSVLDRLESLGPPVVAVHGNVDERALAERLPETATFEVGSARVGLVHDAGPRRGRLERMRRSFPACEAVVFGHSHVPLHEEADDGFQIFNPGSPTERRRSPRHSMGTAEVVGGRLRFELVWL